MALSSINTNRIVVTETGMPSETLVKVFKTGTVEGPCDALAVLLHTFMLETGFKPKGLQNCKQYECMVEYWKTSGIYKIQYYHKLSPEVSCWMTCVPISSLMTVHGTVDETRLDNDINISLKIDDYINKTEGFSDPITVYQHVDELSRIFKDGFCYSLLVSIQNYVDFKPVFGLSGLLEDLKFHILTFLPVESIAAISAANNEFHHLANSTSLWKILFHRDFCKDGVCDPVLVTESDVDWKDLYKTEYSKQMLSKKRARILPSQIPFIPYRHSFTPMHEDNDIDLSIDLDPDIQQAFPHLRRRFQVSNPMLEQINSRGLPSFFRFI